MNKELLLSSKRHYDALRGFLWYVLSYVDRQAEEPKNISISSFCYFCFLLLTILLASAGLRILWSFCFYDNPLRDSMHFAFLRKSFHTCCKDMRSPYLSCPLPLLLLYFSPMITMIYLRLYSY
jgi:hypothetical protein